MFDPLKFKINHREVNSTSTGCATSPQTGSKIFLTIESLPVVDSIEVVL